MSYLYRNLNTEQVVELDERDARLDHLSYRWELLDAANHEQREAAELAERDAALAEQRKRESAEAVAANQRLADAAAGADPAALSGPHPDHPVERVNDDVVLVESHPADGVATGTQQLDGGTVEKDGEKPAKPSRTAARSAWVTYIKGIGGTVEPGATRDELAAKYA